MTNAEAREHLKDILADVPNDKCIDWVMALNQAIKALEQQPCEDYISRKQTLKVFAEKCAGECACCEYNGSGYSTAENCKLIKSLPSVTPQPKIGHWIKMGEGFTPYECSECEAVEFKKSKYCPNCGADMRGEEE